MKLINLLIRKLNNCSLGGDFRISHHAEICQFDCFSLGINFKRARRLLVIMGSPDWVQVKKNIPQGVSKHFLESGEQYFVVSPVGFVFPGCLTRRVINIARIVLFKSIVCFT